MTKYLLSICIPTFNRSDQLMLTIESIVSQKEFLDGRVELVISDNGSSDNTEETVRKYVRRYPQIIYNRNDENIGNVNFPLVIGLANGMLRKLNNDTLQHSAGSLTFLCNVVEKYEKERPAIFFGNNNLKKESREVGDFSDFVEMASYWVTWIGGFSIWEDDCKNIKEDIYGCNEKLWQVRKIYELASQKNRAIVINDEYALTQELAQKNISYGLFHIFYENYTSFLKPYVDNGKISIGLYEKIEKDLLFDFFFNWMIEWENQKGAYKYSDSENLVEAITNQYNDKPYWREFYKKYNIKKRKLKIKKAIKAFLGRA